jgi:hypothetical protein
MQPALLHLSLMMLLAHSYVLLQQQSVPVHKLFANSSGSSGSSSNLGAAGGADASANSSSSSSPDAVEGAEASANSSSSSSPDAVGAAEASSAWGGGTASSSGSAGGSSSTSSGASNGRSSSSNDKKQKQIEMVRKLDKVCQTQHQKQQLRLVSSIEQLWQQLGLPLTALPTFADAVEETPFCMSDDPDVIETTARCVLMSLQDIITPANAPQAAQQGTAAAAGTTVPFDQLSRQVQQLLPGVIWQLPLLLLQLATLANVNDEDAVHVETMTRCAAVSVQAWGMPGLPPPAHSIAAAAGGGGTLAPASHSSNNPAATTAAAGAAAAGVTASAGAAAAPASTELLPALVDTCLAVMQSLLLQLPHGLLQAAAAAKVETLPDQHVSICPHVEPVATAAAMDNLIGQAWTCFDADCHRMAAVCNLLALARDLADAAAPGAPFGPPKGMQMRHVWLDRAPALLLMLETLVRCVLPHQLFCECCELQSGEMISDAAQMLRVQLSNFVGASQSSLLLGLCTDMLRHTVTSPEFQQQPIQQQQQLQQSEQQHQHLQLQQQRLLHLWSLLTSLLKLPIRPVTGVPLIQACMKVTSAALQQYLKPAAPKLSIAQQREVLLPWLVLQGRCFLVLAQLLQAIKDLPPPADLQPLSDCVGVAFECLQHTRVTWRWFRMDFRNSPSNSIDSSSSSSSSTRRSIQDGMSAASQVLQEGEQRGEGAAAAVCAVGTSVQNLPKPLGQVQRDLRVFGPVDGMSNRAQQSVHGLSIALVMAQQNMAELDVACSTNSGGDRTSSRTSGTSSTSSDRTSSSTSTSSTSSSSTSSSSTSTFERWRVIAASSELAESIAHLQTLGMELCHELPMPWLCNNPHCSNLSGVSELQLVGGKACVCSGCREAR